ncbi:hypothetical protein G6F57_021807 [Rhizopus arrhizus]|nr:hypothetical protein G6F57_021807 [Rhizopus arrhizus]
MVPDLSQPAQARLGQAGHLAHPRRRAGRGLKRRPFGAAADPAAAPALPTRMRRKIGTDAPCAPIARRPRPPGHGGMALPPMPPSSWPL